MRISRLMFFAVAIYGVLIDFAWSYPTFSWVLQANGGLLVTASNPDKHGWQCNASWTVSGDNFGTSTDMPENQGFYVPPKVSNVVVLDGGGVDLTGPVLTSGPSIACPSDAKISKQNVVLGMAHIIRRNAVVQAYSVVNLGYVADVENPSALATAINNVGLVIGETYSPLPALIQIGFRWTSVDGMTPLPQPSAPPIGAGVTDGPIRQFYLTSVNSNGFAVGSVRWANGGPGAQRALLWQGGSVTDLSTLGGLNAAATGINDMGQIVGWSQTNLNPNYEHPFIWENGTMRDLGLPTNGIFQNCVASSINNSGEVVGFCMHTGSGNANDPTYAQSIIWQNRTVYIVGQMPSYSFASAVNDRGDVVGAYCKIDNSQCHAYMYRGTGTFIDLGVAPNFTDSKAVSINNSGVVVGNLIKDQFSHPFVWQSNIGILDLNDLIPSDSGWELLQVTAINQLGQIVGFGKYNNQQAAFILSPKLQ